MGRTDGARLSSLFFFQAEDGMPDIGVTGVQACALPISAWRGGQDPGRRVPGASASATAPAIHAPAYAPSRPPNTAPSAIRPITGTGVSETAAWMPKIGRASCRERV